MCLGVLVLRFNEGIDLDVVVFEEDVCQVGQANGMALGLVPVLMNKEELGVWCFVAEAFGENAVDVEVDELGFEVMEVRQAVALQTTVNWFVSEEVI